MQPMLDDMTEKIMAKVRRRLSDEMQSDVPSPVFVEMDMRIVRYIENQSLAVALPVNKRHGNSWGGVQMGVVASAFDEAFHIFSCILTRRPCENVSVTLAQLRSAPVSCREITFEARLRAKTHRLVFMEGKAMNEEGKTIATASATFMPQKVHRGEGDGEYVEFESGINKGF